MKRKRYSPEQIIAMLREVEVKISQGMPALEVSRQLGIAEQTYCLWYLIEK